MKRLKLAMLSADSQASVWNEEVLCEEVEGAEKSDDDPYGGTSSHGKQNERQNTKTGWAEELAFGAVSEGQGREA